MRYYYLARVNKNYGLLMPHTQYNKKADIIKTTLRNLPMEFKSLRYNLIALNLPNNKNQFIWKSKKFLFSYIALCFCSVSLSRGQTSLAWEKHLFQLVPHVHKSDFNRKTFKLIHLSFKAHLFRLWLDTNDSVFFYFLSFRQLVFVPLIFAVQFSNLTEEKQFKWQLSFNET